MQAGWLLSTRVRRSGIFAIACNVPERELPATLAVKERLRPESVILSEVEISGKRSSSKFLIPLLSRKISPLVPEAGSAQPIAWQHFDALVVMLAMCLYFQGAFRFRAVGRILSLLGKVFYKALPAPGYTTVRIWAHRIGLYRLVSAKLGPRWTMVCDHTATFGGLKMFVICGVDLDVLVAGPVRKVRCLALVDDAVDRLVVVVVELHVVLRLRPRSS